MTDNGVEGSSGCAIARVAIYYNVGGCVGVLRQVQVGVATGNAVVAWL